ncbi:ABC transporter ATP-binding protein [Sphaerisporangium sp. NPDC004334]
MISALALAWRAAPGMFLLQIALTAASALVPVVTAWLLKLILDGAVGGAEWSALLVMAALMAAVTASGTVFLHGGNYLRTEVERRVSRLCRSRLFAAVNRFVGLGRFEDPSFQDHLRSAQDVGPTAPDDIINGFLGGLRGLIMACGFVVAVATINPVVAVAVMLAAVPALAAERFLVRRRVRVFWAMSPALRRELFYGRLQSDLRAVKELRLFGLGDFFRERMLAERLSADAAQRKVDRRTWTLQALLGLLSALVAGAVLVWGVAQLRTGLLTIGDVSVLVAVIAGVQSGLSQVIGEYAVVHRGLLLFGHYLAVVNAGPELPVAEDPRAIAPLSRGIEFRDVWFRYSPDHPWVLRGINLHVKKGDALAIVGLNGAGKSTMVKLLFRYYDPTEGAVLWDGVDIRLFAPEDLRRRVSGVFQDPMEYDLTAAENIGLGDLDHMGDRARVRGAGTLAGIDIALRRLPDGYDTFLSRMFGKPMDALGEPAAETRAVVTDPPEEEPPMRGEADAAPAAAVSCSTGAGMTLSGGQWQRLAFARALFREGRDVLVLDEPNSGLDPAAESEIHSTLQAHRQDWTSIMISHRLSAVREADVIVLIEDGRIAEQGSHARLMAMDGRYAGLFRTQASGYSEVPSNA